MNALRFAPKFYALCAALLVTAALSFCAGSAVSGDRGNRASVALPETLYVEAKARTDTVRQTIREQVTRWQVDTLWRSDTVTVNDTVRVLIPAPTLARMDSTIRACAKLDTLVSQERTACERVQAELRRDVKRKDWGCTVGVGGVVTLDGRTAAGASVTCGRRIGP